MILQAFVKWGPIQKTPGAQEEHANSTQKGPLADLTQVVGTDDMKE